MAYKNKEYMRQYNIKNKEKIKQYRIDNKENIKKNKREYYIKNKEKLKERTRLYRIENKEEVNKKKKQYYLDNPDKQRERGKKYYIENKDKVLKWHKQWIKDHPDYDKQRYIDNKEKINKCRGLRNIIRRRTDLKFNLNSRMAIMVWYCLRKNKANQTWESFVDYTLNDLIKRLNETMPEGYNWQDYLKGKLHIDHIIPKSIFQYKTPEDEEFKQCWSLYNLRLLPAKENLSKKDKITNPILLYLLFKEEKLLQPALAI